MITKMKSYYFRCSLCLFSTLLLFSQTCLSWNWFFSSTKEETGTDNNNFGNYKEVVSEFSMEYLNDKNGIELIKSAKSKMVDMNSCWQTAYQNVFQGCSKALADEEFRSRLAWHLSDCFQQHTGRSPFPYCDAKSTMKRCLENIDEDAYQIYLKYFLETNSMCHHLQTSAFKKQTERLVNELKTSAEYAEEKLENIDKHEELLIQNAKEVQDSLSSLDLKSERVAKTTKDIEGRVNSVLKYSESIYEQFHGIAVSQVELSKSQVEMKENLEEGTEWFKDSFDNLGQEVNHLRKEAVVIEKQIERVGNVMFVEMNSLERKADDIGNMAGKALDKQKQLSDGQTEALTSLDFLFKFQTEALQESRENLQKLVEFGHKQQEELLQRQDHLHQTHDSLVENSKLILATQEAFESKQANMFVSIDKLFTLHTSMLFESRVFIALFMYSIAIFIIYMLTSIKSAYNVRHRFYIGLCITFLIEISILWYVSTDYEQQGRMINMVRSLFGFLATAQYLFAICTYSDYEAMNHEMLLTLMEKINGMQVNNNELLSLNMDMDMDIDSEVDYSSLIDKDVVEDLELLGDSDSLALPEKSPHTSLPKKKVVEKFPEEVGENFSSSSTTSSTVKRYNLRRHKVYIKE